MKVYTYTEARRKLADVLNEAREEGEVRIRRRHGEEFSVRPVSERGSPFDVGEPVSTHAKITRQDIVDAVRAGRERKY